MERPAYLQKAASHVSCFVGVQKLQLIQKLKKNEKMFLKSVREGSAVVCFQITAEGVNKDIVPAVTVPARQNTVVLKLLQLSLPGVLKEQLHIRTSCLKLKPLLLTSFSRSEVICFLNIENYKQAVDLCEILYWCKLCSDCSATLLTRGVCVGGV